MPSHWRDPLQLPFLCGGSARTTRAGTLSECPEAKLQDWGSLASLEWRRTPRPCMVRPLTQRRIRVGTFRSAYRTPYGRTLLLFVLFFQSLSLSLSLSLPLPEAKPTGRHRGIDPESKKGAENKNTQCSCVSVSNELKIESRNGKDMFARRLIGVCFPSFLFIGFIRAAAESNLV